MSEIEEVKYKESEEQPEDMPEFMTKLSNGMFKVKTRDDGDFILKDSEWEKVERVMKNPGLKNKENVALIVSALEEPKLGELDFDKKPSSTVFRLLRAVYWLYDIKDFL